MCGCQCGAPPSCRGPGHAGRGWAWALWQATIPLPKGAKGQLELVCKATDENYNTQVGGSIVGQPWHGMAHGMKSGWAVLHVSDARVLAWCTQAGHVGRRHAV